jgi:hypothetical protein
VDGHVARIGEKRNTYRILTGIQKEPAHREEKDVRMWIMLRWIL